MKPDASSDADRRVDCDDSPMEGDFHTKFERLFRQENSALLGMLYVRLRDKEWARDVAQRAFLRVFTREKAETLSILRAATMAHLRNYLFRAAINIAANDQRDSRVHNGHLASMYVDGETPSAEILCAHQQEWARLQRALAELPRQCRTAFLLVQVEGRKPADVAVEMGVKRNTVYQLVRRAYEHLMQALASEDGGEP